jgi:hypothetical protein
MRPCGGVPAIGALPSLVERRATAASRPYRQVRRRLDAHVSHWNYACSPTHRIAGASRGGPRPRAYLLACVGTRRDYEATWSRERNWEPTFSHRWMECHCNDRARLRGARIVDVQPLQTPFDIGQKRLAQPISVQKSVLNWRAARCWCLPASHPARPTIHLSHHSSPSPRSRRRRRC